ncbi:MAG: NTP transferase domain-containing protein [Methanosarcinales archaeon]|jgi:UTP--glucose-1-phosphate uridylyltransferase|nr:NTP transferase domain-containing protein [Methanosarcinales archaeon]
MKIKTAIIPAGGYGSRMAPITKAVPKSMLPIICKPVIHHIVQECESSGIENIIIVTGFCAEVIENYFSRQAEFDSKSYKPADYFEGLNLEFIRQDKPLGLADAVICSESFVEGDNFAVLLGDDIFRGPKPGISQLSDVYEKGHLIGALPMPIDRLSNYGVLIPSEKHSNPFQICTILEKPEHKVDSDMAVAGRYIFDSSIFDKLKYTFSIIGAEANLTDALNLSIQRGDNVKGIKMQGIRYDVGNEQEYIETILAAVQGGWY